MLFKQQSELKYNLAELAKKYASLKIGIVGSFARNSNTEKSDIDIVLDKKNGVITEQDIDLLLQVEENIKSLANNEWDILWLSTLKDEQNSYIQTMNTLGLEISKDECIYDNILKDVIWVE